VSLPTVLPAPLGRDEVRELQSRLRALGFAPGPVDGIAGGKTEVALQRYRESRRLGERLAARELLERLRAEPPSR
jgi:peptidoglycan hydrolase-like protein with peptidoglycan-binding domain